MIVVGFMFGMILFLKKILGGYGILVGIVEMMIRMSLP